MDTGEIKMTEEKKILKDVLKSIDKAREGLKITKERIETFRDKIKEKY